MKRDLVCTYCIPYFSYFQYFQSIYGHTSIYSPHNPTSHSVLWIRGSSMIKSIVFWSNEPFTPGLWPALTLEFGGKTTSRYSSLLVATRHYSSLRAACPVLQHEPNLREKSQQIGSRIWTGQVRLKYTYSFQVFILFIYVYLCLCMRVYVYLCLSMLSYAYHVCNCM